MPTPEQLDVLRRADPGAAEQGGLPDASLLALGNGLGKGERAAYVLEQLKNSYCFRCGGLGVKIEFDEGAPSLQDALTGLLKRQKNGL